MFNMMQMISSIQRSGNPMQAMMQMTGTNPMMAQAMQMAQGKSPAQMQAIAINMARERGVDLNSFARQMGIKI